MEVIDLHRRGPNKVTREVRDLARKLVEDPEYLECLRLRLILGTAGPIEPLIWHYAFGKPKETVEMQGEVGLKIVREILDPVTDDSYVDAVKH